MNKKQEQNKKEEFFWQQFPEGTEEFAFSMEEFILLKFPTFCQPIVYEDYQIRKSLTSPINKGF